MEDECSIGNDETRIFILSNLASNKMNKVPCVLCKQYLTVFDRYPLIDGTFFLSPRQHNRTCVQVKIDGKASFLTPVCMHCLEGWTANIGCKFCGKPWTGGHLILGTMYSYDIFAAVPCCPERLKCNNCKQLVIHPDQRFSFFSDYSQIVSCPHCGVQEAHFAKNLPSIFAFIPRRGVTRVNSAWKKESKLLTKKAKKVWNKPPPRCSDQTCSKNNEAKRKKEKKILRSFSETKKHCYSSSSYLCAFPKKFKQKPTQSQN